MNAAGQDSSCGEITVIVPNWNGGERLETVLRQLRLQTHSPLQVVVVDNGSTDGSEEAAERLGAKVIRFGVNQGFAAAVNAGVAEARTELLAILNNDVELDAHWMARLVQAVSSDDAAFATGKILQARQRDRIDGAFDEICQGGAAWRCGSGKADSELWNARREIRFASLTAAVFRAAVFRELGPLDERFESYLEDVDFGLRCASKGYSGVYVPDAVAYHVGSATLGAWHAQTVRRIARNQVFLIAKHYPLRTICKNGWAIAVAQGLWGLLAFRHGAGLAFVRGKFEGCRRFRELRQNGNATVSRILYESESEIHRLQMQSGFDWYWRMYFALT